MQKVESTSATGQWHGCDEMNVVIYARTLRVANSTGRRNTCIESVCPTTVLGRTGSGCGSVSIDPNRKYRISAWMTGKYCTRTFRFRRPSAVNDPRKIFGHVRTCPFCWIINDSSHQPARVIPCSIPGVFLPIQRYA